MTTCLHLKSCFLYLSIFPEDSKIEADQLIQLWIAEGFIPKKQELTLEELAEDSLEELIDRSMVKEVSRNGFRRVEIISIHDLLLDLALSEAREINFLNIYDKSRDFSPLSNSRRIAICNQFEEYTSLNLFAPKVRSLVYTGPSTYAKETKFSFRSCLHAAMGCRHFNDWKVVIYRPTQLLSSYGSRFLRVIDLHGARLKSLPENIGDMIQLRYLGLRSTGLYRLPSSIGKLVNLQTLDIRGTWIASVPKSFWRILTLRHLFFDVGDFRSKPRVVCGLNDMQTLEGVRCGSWVGTGLAIRMRNLRHLNLLRVSDATASCLVSALEGLHHLVSLELDGDSLPIEVLTLSTCPRLQHMVLIGPLRRHPLTPPRDGQQATPNLIRLDLRRSELGQDDIAVLAGRPELCFLQVENAYIDGTLLFPAQGFPRLEELELKILDELETLEVAEGGLSSLRKMTINWCEKLRTLLFPAHGFPRLEELVLDSLYKLETLEVAEGGLSSLRKMTIDDCEKLRTLPEGLRHMKSLTLFLLNMATFVESIRSSKDQEYDKTKHIQNIDINDVDAEEWKRYCLGSGEEEKVVENLG